MPNSSSESSRTCVAEIRKILSEFRGGFDEWQCEFETLLEDTAAALEGDLPSDAPQRDVTGDSWTELNRLLGAERAERRQQQADLARELCELRLLLETRPRFPATEPSVLAAGRSSQRSTADAIHVA